MIREESCCAMRGVGRRLGKLYAMVEVGTNGNFARQKRWEDGQNPRLRSSANFPLVFSHTIDS